MYGNLQAEMARKNISRREIARQLGITATTLSLKLNGKSNLTLDECVRIKKIIGTDESLDYLFQTEEEVV